MLEVRIDGVHVAGAGGARVSTARSEATEDYSNRQRPAFRATAVRAGLALAGLAGAVLLVLATFSPVVEISVLTTSDIAADIDTSLTGGERHGPALVLLGAFAAVMLAGALRGARPAAGAVVAAALAVLAIALVADLPDLDDTRGVEELYEGASAGAGSGYYLETAGGALLLLAGGGLLLLPAPRRPEA